MPMVVFLSVSPNIADTEEGKEFVGIVEYIGTVDPVD